MKKRNCLFALALPLLLLAACSGEGDSLIPSSSPSSSESSKTSISSSSSEAGSDSSSEITSSSFTSSFSEETLSSSESLSSSSEISSTEVAMSHKVDEEAWEHAFDDFGKATNYTCHSEISGKSISSVGTVKRDGNWWRIDGSDSPLYFVNKEDDGLHLYSELPGSSYYAEDSALASLVGPSCEQMTSSIRELFLNSYADFAFDEASSSYKGSKKIESKYLGDGLSASSADIALEAHFDEGALVSLSAKYVYGKELGNGVDWSSYSFSDFGSTSFIAPSSEKITDKAVGDYAWQNSVFSFSSFSVTSTSSSSFVTSASISGRKVKISSSEEGELPSYRERDDAYYFKFVPVSANNYAYREDEEGESFWEGVSKLTSTLKGLSSLYSSFSFDEEKMAFTLSSLTTDLGTLSDLVVSFSSNKLSSISFDFGDMHLDIDGFDESDFALPGSESISDNAICGASEWNEAFDDLKKEGNCRIEYIKSSSDGEKIERAYTLDSGNLEVYFSTSTNEAPLWKAGKNGDDTYTFYEYIGDYTDKYETSSSDECSSFVSDASLLLSRTCADLCDMSSSFAFDEKTLAYKADSITFADRFYSDISLSFEKGKIAEIAFSYGEGEDEFIITFSDIGSSSVALPSGKTLFKEGQLKRDEWDGAFVAAASSAKWEYNQYYGYTDDDNNYCFTTTYYLDEHKLKYEYRYDSYKPDESHTITTEFYSAEDKKNYSYVYNEAEDGTGKWVKEETSGESDYFVEAEEALMLFVDRYSDFDYNDGTYHASAIEIDGSTYENVEVGVKEGQIVGIYWSCNGYNCSIDNIGQTSVELPEVE
jgi:hypothetical protein